MSDSGRKVIHTDVDTGLCVVNDSGDDQEDEVSFFIILRKYFFRVLIVMRTRVTNNYWCIELYIIISMC